MKRALPTNQSSPSIALVRTALHEKGMRQQELARRTGLSKDHISRVLLGKVPFPHSRDTLTAIAHALGLDPLLFPEYREQLQVLPESTRRLAAHLKQRGIAQQEFIRRVPSYSEGHLQLILRGGSPFPRDPHTIELFATAAEASPFLFPEYLPLKEWRARLQRAAELALDKADQGVFGHLLGKIERHFESLGAGEASFEERLLRHFLARHFGTPTPDPELDDALAYLPPLEQYQPEVRALLRRMHERGLSVHALATAIGGDEATLFAIANGQMRLKDGPIKQKLWALLDLAEEPA